ncbi:MAG: hypothetical protein KGJ88_01935 [Verrucomicrobiota bacterium]|nr:hypothetical protein [Verrucomicrobiota bacterium]
MTRVVDLILAAKQRDAAADASLREATAWQKGDYVGRMAFLLFLKMAEGLDSLCPAAAGIFVQTEQENERQVKD